MSAETKKCTRCDGCGQVADSDSGEPWTAWASLPPGSDLAVRMGIVKPVPCPECKGGVSADGSTAHTTHCVARQTWGDGECECADADRDRKAADYDRLRDENEALRKLKRCGEGETAESCWLCGEGHRPGQYLHTCSRCGSLVCEECSEDDGNDESVCYQLALDQYARKTAAVSDACAELAEARAAVEAMRRERDAATARAEALEAALRGLLKHAERNECQHEETERLGLNWTRCRACGREWADDRGGFQPYVEPQAFAAAYEALAATPPADLTQPEIHIVFDGPPGTEAGRFVEVENAAGRSIWIGRWEERGGYWHLIIGATDATPTEPVCCPVDDPDCEGGDDQSHDACERPDLLNNPDFRAGWIAGRDAAAAWCEKDAVEWDEIGAEEERRGDARRAVMAVHERNAAAALGRDIRDLEPPTDVDATKFLPVWPERSLAVEALLLKLYEAVAFDDEIMSKPKAADAATEVADVVCLLTDDAGNEVRLVDLRGAFDLAQHPAYRDGYQAGQEEMRERAAKKLCRYAGDRCNSGRCPCRAIRALLTKEVRDA